MFFTKEKARCSFHQWCGQSLLSYPGREKRLDKNCTIVAWIETPILDLLAHGYTTTSRLRQRRQIKQDL